MLAEKLSNLNSDLPTRPINARPVPRREAPAPRREAAAPVEERLHLMLVRTPRPTPRSLAWARRGGARPLDATELESMLRLERLNLG